METTRPRAPPDYPRGLRRAVVCVLFVPVMLWIILERVWIELRDIPFYVRCDVAENFADAKRWWR